jgi:hypothetical protein
MYYETTITPCASGFGEYQQNYPNGEGWELEADLVTEMFSNEPELLELGTDELPDGIEDIRGRIHNQAGRIFVLPGTPNQYFAVVEIEEEQ